MASPGRFFRATESDEVRELHKQIEELKAQLAAEKESTETERSKRTAIEKHMDFVLHARDGSLASFQPIGVVRSVYRDMRNIPRQGNIVPSTLARIELRKEMQPDQSLDGLEQFSHVWVIFVFNQNSGLVRIQNKQKAATSGACAMSVKAKVKPPRLQGASVGVFSTRSPHRPVPLGMTVARVTGVDRARGIIRLQGIDLADNTPVIDIKPYIPRYDSIPDATVPAWINEGALREPTQVSVSSEARAMLSTLPLQFYSSRDDMLEAIRQVLSYDIRSIYHHNKPVSSLPAAQPEDSPAAAPGEDDLMAVDDCRSPSSSSASLSSSSCSSLSSSSSSSSSPPSDPLPRPSPSRSPRSSRPRPITPHSCPPDEANAEARASTAPTVASPARAAPPSAPRAPQSGSVKSTFEMHFDDVLCRYTVSPTTGNVMITEFLPAPAESGAQKFNYRIVTPGMLAEGKEQAATQGEESKGRGGKGGKGPGKHGLAQQQKQQTGGGQKEVKRAKKARKLQEMGQGAQKPETVTE